MSTHFVFLFFKDKRRGGQEESTDRKKCRKKNVGRQRNTQHISPI